MIAGATSANYLENNQVVGIYFLGVFVGAGTSTIFVQALAMTAELIGTNSTSAAFVYGAMCCTGLISLRLKYVNLDHVFQSFLIMKRAICNSKHQKF